MIKWILMTTVAGSIASLCLLLFRTKLTALCGGRLYYFVCLSALLLFIVPVPIEMRMSAHSQSWLPGGSITSITHKASSLWSGSADAGTRAATELPSPSTEGEGSRSFPVLPTEVWIAGVWFSGFIVVLCQYFMNYFRFKRRALQGTLIDKAGSLNVIWSEYVHSPMLIGFIKPQIVFPAASMSVVDYQLALQHELTHYKQKDPWFKLAAVVINCLHWFNPISYLALANISEACEYSVDESVSRTMKSTDKKRYSEMILHFAAQSSPALNSGLSRSKKQLYRRFRLIMHASTGRSRELSGILTGILIAATALFSTSYVFAKETRPITEFSGGIRTYYDINADLETNVQDTLGVYERGSGVYWGNLYIDENGLKIDYFNRTEPYYKVAMRWKAKNNPDVAGMIQKTFTIEGRTVTAAFSDQAAAYKDDGVIKKMIANQIAFELTSYNKNKKWDYDHAAFIDELIRRGAYVLYDIKTPKQFTFDLHQANGGDLIGHKPLTAYDKKAKQKDIFDKSVLLPESPSDASADGTQGVQLGKSFVIESGETLAITVHETTDRSPTISLAVIDETTGKVAYWYPAALSGYRHIYTPGASNANHTYKVVASGETEDTVKVDIFTYASGEEATSWPPLNGTRTTSSISVLK